MFDYVLSKLCNCLIIIILMASNDYFMFLRDIFDVTSLLSYHEKSVITYHLFSKCEVAKRIINSLRLQNIFTYLKH